MTLHADFTVAIGALELRVELDAPAGAVTAVLGPNGAGKTSLLRAVAGTVAIDRGTICLGGTALDAPPDTFVAPERRRLGIVHQDHLLFPHLSAVDNVAFGPRSRGRSRRDARRLATELLAGMGLADHVDDKPRTLSGGQAQRVALARALAAEPEALLLDEPLAALDAGTRVEVRRELRRHLTGFAGPTLLVTHDPVDVLALADHVGILEHGRITQSGTVADVTARPRSRYVADLIGTNLVLGTGSGRTITTASGATLATAEGHDGPVFATVPPTAIALHRTEPEGSPRNRWRATIAQVEPLGDRMRVHLAGPLDLVAEVTSLAVADLALREGDEVWASVKATEVSAYLR